MKPALMVPCALALSLTCGIAGFFLGKNQRATDHTAPQQATVTTAYGSKSGADRRAILSKPDLEKFRNELYRETNPLARYNMAISKMEAWVNADPKGVLDWLKNQENTGRRAETIRIALGQFAENNPQAAAQWALANLTGVDLNNALIRIAEEWARRDGLQAAQWLTSLPAGNERNAALEGMFFVWGSREPAAAVDFIKSHAGSESTSATLRYAAYAGWAKSDPQNAVMASLESSRTYRDPGQFANTLANWATIDLTASSSWLLANVRDGEWRTTAISELTTIFAHQSPQAGLAWADKLNAGPERESAVNQLATEWATADPEASAKWAGEQKTTHLTEHTLSEIVTNFAAKDDGAFDAWRTSLAPGPLKDAADKIAASDQSHSQE